VYAINADDGTGRWRFLRAVAVRAPSIVFDGVIDIGSFGGSVHALDLDLTPTLDDPLPLVREIMDLPRAQYGAANCLSAVLHEAPAQN
jgi:hypothetical protein